MKVTKIPKSVVEAERRILTALIVSTDVCAKLSANWLHPQQQQFAFKNEWSNLIAGWCARYYAKYQKAPSKNIATYYERWAAKQQDSDNTELSSLVARYLDFLSGQWEGLHDDLNPGFVIDQAQEYFAKQQLMQLYETLEDKLLQGGGGDEDGSNLTSMIETVQSFNPLNLTARQGVDVLQDKENLQKAFEEAAAPLFTHTGALGNFFDSQFRPDTFISFMGPEKRGKTFWLLDTAWRAVEARNPTVFFSAGDMTAPQVMRRLATRAARRPLKAGRLVIPRRYEVADDEDSGTTMLSMVDYKERFYDTPLTWQESWKSFQRTSKMRLKSSKSFFKLCCHPSNALSVGGIDSQLRQWEREEGWVPRVIIIDYADILDMSSMVAGKEVRDRINYTWAHLRGLSQKWHCCVVTATQANAESYKTTTLSMSNFSEDKRKLSHVTGMIGINQTFHEKKEQLQRLNWIVLRESDFDISRQVYVGNCFGICNPAVCSSLDPKNWESPLKRD